MFVLLLCKLDTSLRGYLPGQTGRRPKQSYKVSFSLQHNLIFAKEKKIVLLKEHD